MWWLSTADDLRLQHMASVYVGPLVFLLGLYKVLLFKPWAAIIFMYGTFESFLRWTRGQMHANLMVASVIGHFLVYVPYMEVSDRYEHVLTTVLLGGLLLTVYRGLGLWPYQTSPLHSTVLVTCLVIVLHF